MPATDLTCGSQANSRNKFSPATLWQQVIRPAVPTWQMFRWIYTEDCDNSIFNVTFERRDAVCSVSSGSYGRTARDIEMSRISGELFA